jgi:hypothetical protein
MKLGDKRDDLVHVRWYEGKMMDVMSSLLPCRKLAKQQNEAPYVASINKQYEKATSK